MHICVKTKIHPLVTSIISTWPNIKIKDSFEILRTSRFQNLLFEFGQIETEILPKQTSKVFFVDMVYFFPVCIDCKDYGYLMDSYLQTLFSCESNIACIWVMNTFEWLHSCMYPHVNFEVGVLWKLLSTLSTRMLDYLLMNLILMPVQSIFWGKYSAAGLTM